MDRNEQRKKLEKTARTLRRNVVTCVGVGTPGHIGGSCSAADLIAALYFWKMQFDPRHLDWPQRDRFLLSKGHIGILQYAALAEQGVYPLCDLPRTKELGFHLQGHPDYLKTKGVEAGTGSLGQGLSVGLGMALGNRYQGIDSRVYVILGDGEMAEGQVWEAIGAAAAHKADHLIAILDQNGLESQGPVAERMDITPFPEKFAAFGWNVLEIDGHDMGQIMDALDAADRFNGKPTVIIAHTIKGKGISFAENVVGFHNVALTQEQYQAALDELADDQE